MFCYLLWGVGITLSLSAVAKKSPAPILIRAPNTPVKEFLAYAETEPVQTYLQHQIDHNKKKPRPVNLRSLLKQAQMDFLSHEPKSSKKSWQAIADHIHSFDWNKEERKIIFYSLLRLAQLEKDSRKKDLLLKEALTFSMGLKPDTQIFPPPLTNRYAQLKKSATFVPLNLKAVFPQHSAILINGRVYSHHEKPILPEGFYKVSALSTSHEKWTKTLSLSRLLSKKVKTPPLTKGSCQKPILENKHLQTKNLLILFPNFCVWDSSLKLAQEQTTNPGP